MHVKELIVLITLSRGRKSWTETTLTKNNISIPFNGTRGIMARVFEWYLNYVLLIFWMSL